MSESRKAFESHVNQYDTFGDEWQDKGVDEHFISGYEAGKAARAGQESEPFAFCFTDVNGKPSEFCDHPKHAAEGDTRIRTPLYTHPVSAAKQAVSVPYDRVSVHEYTARIALQALEEYAENLSIVAGWDYEPLEHHYAQQAIEDIQDKLTEKERGHD